MGPGWARSCNRGVPGVKGAGTSSHTQMISSDEHRQSNCNRTNGILNQSDADCSNPANNTSDCILTNVRINQIDVGRCNAEHQDGPPKDPVQAYSTQAKPPNRCEMHAIQKPNPTRRLTLASAPPCGFLSRPASRPRSPNSKTGSGCRGPTTGSASRLVWSTLCWWGPSNWTSVGTGRWVGWLGWLGWFVEKLLGWLVGWLDGWGVEWGGYLIMGAVAVIVVWLMVTA